MERVIIMGPPGSGKSTLARHVGQRYGLPVFHLDQAYWLPGWVENDPTAFRAEVERIAAAPAWVVDGNYSHTLEPRLAAADTLIYLDIPTWRCMLRIVARTIRHFGKARADAALGCPERFDIGFLRFAWTWNCLRRAGNLALLEEFPGRKIVVRGGDARLVGV